jgi:hypothetical protein
MAAYAYLVLTSYVDDRSREARDIYHDAAQELATGGELFDRVAKKGMASECESACAAMVKAPNSEGPVPASYYSPIRSYRYTVTMWSVATQKCTEVPHAQECGRLSLVSAVNTKCTIELSQFFFPCAVLRIGLWKHSSDQQ